MNVLGMFARHPLPGRTKTRLAAAIGDEAAAQLYAAFVEDLIQRCSSLADEFVIAATPNDEPTSRWFNERIFETDQLIFQPGGSLGERIAWFFETTLKPCRIKSVLIGSDSPDLPSSIIESAFEKLDSVDVVIAPASDGGFVLIGLATPPPKDLFHDITWSSVRTLDETMNACARQNLSVELLPEWYDIDTIENLATFLQRQNESDESVPLPRTLAALKLAGFS